MAFNSSRRWRGDCIDMSAGHMQPPNKKSPEIVERVAAQFRPANWNSARNPATNETIMAPQQRQAEIRKLEDVLATTRPTSARQTILKRLWRLGREANAETQSI